MHRRDERARRGRATQTRESAQSRENIKKRAKAIAKANRQKLSAKDKLQIALVVLVIVGIVLGALVLTNAI